MIKIRKRIIILLFSLMIVLFTFTIPSVFAYTGGELNGKSMVDGITIGIPSSTTSTYTLLTDNNESTQDRVNYYASGHHIIMYHFAQPVSLKSYKLKGTGSIIIVYKLQDGTSGSFPSSFLTGVETSIPVLPNVAWIGLSNSSGNYAYVSEFDVFSSADKFPPAVPAGLIATAGAAKVDLAWTANSESDLSVYKIYRDNLYLTTIGKPTVIYSDRGLTAGRSYAYALSAVDLTGNESVKSASVSAVPAGIPDTTAPAVPTGLRTTYEGGGLAHILWNANTEEDLSGYNLYYQGAKVNTSGLITGTMSSITGLLAGQSYSYQVTAVDLAGNESARSMAATVYVPSPFSVNLVPNMDSIVVQVTGGKPPYTVAWGSNSQTFNATTYSIEGLVAATNYQVTITDSDGYSHTLTVNTGTMKSFVPPTISSPVGAFQKMIDNFGGAGSIAFAIIMAAVSLGVIVILGMWGWRLGKRWLFSTK